MTPPSRLQPRPMPIPMPQPIRPSRPVRPTRHMLAYDQVLRVDDPTLRPVRGLPGYLEPVPVPKKGDLVSWGEFYIKNGKDSEFRSRNKVVGQGLRHIINTCFTTSPGGSVVSGVSFNTNLTVSYIRVGTGGGVTLDGTVGLTSQVAVNPNTFTTDRDIPVPGTYRFKAIATWNAGAISAVTVTEYGLFGTLATTLGSSAQTPLVLFARSAAADAEFNQFTINNAAPLTIEYRYSNVFA